MTPTISDVSVTQRDPGNTSGLIQRVFDVSIPSGSYTTGGVAIPASQFGLTSIVFFLVEASPSGYKPVYDHAAGKLKVFTTGSGSGNAFTELANAAAVAVSARALILGK